MSARGLLLGKHDDDVVQCMSSWRVRLYGLVEAYVARAGGYEWVACGLEYVQYVGVARQLLCTVCLARARQRDLVPTKQ